MSRSILLSTMQSTFSLANDGVLALKFIGTGSAFSKKFYQNNLLVVKGQNHLLVDCGTRTPEALNKVGLSVTNIKNYLITHSHADHIGGLEEVMLVNRYGPGKKPNIIITKSYEDVLWEMSLKGGAAFNETRDGKYMEFSDFWKIVRPKPVKYADRERSVVTLGDIEIIIFRTKHIPDSSSTWEDSALSYGLILDKTVLFTSDMRYDPEMVIEFNKEFNFKTIFHDCQLFKGGVHASIDELSELPSEIKAKMFLMHYQDNAETQSERIKKLGFAGFAKQWKTYEFPENFSIESDT